MEENLIIGFPRSGNNWVRYIIEYFTEYSTLWEVRDSDMRRPLHYIVDEIDSINKSDNKLFYNSHFPNNNTVSNNYKLILIVRNYKECIVRNVIKGQKEVNDANFKKIKNQLINMYLPLLEKYDNYSGLKLIINYEEIIDKNLLLDVIKKICIFLNNINYEKKMYNFFKNYQLHIENSKNLYNTINQCYSDSISKVFHSKKLTNTQILDLELIVKKNNQLYEKYLKKY